MGKNRQHRGPDLPALGERWRARDDKSEWTVRAVDNYSSYFWVTLRAPGVRDVRVFGRRLHREFSRIGGPKP